MNDRAVQLVAVAICLASLATAGSLARSIGAERQQHDLVISLAETRGMPPHVALATAALGTFRGLAVDTLWMRAGRLQDAGQYYEAQTLSQWITTLQPRFPRVWAFQAWNLAYNISASTRVAEERWGWVQRGMELLRTRGIPLNPADADLPMELGWIYFHKIGGKADREHWYYKARLAREFREVLGDMAGGVTTQQAIDRFATVAEAADSLDEVRQDPAVSDALALIKEHGALPDESFLRMLARVLLYRSSVDARIQFGSGLPEGTNRPLVMAIQADERLRQAVTDTIVPCLQKRVLVDRYRMDPAFMLELMQAYGPLDWAHPHAHGIYWSEQGIALARSSRRREQINELSLIRTRLGNLQYLMRSGRIEFDPLTNRIDILPDPRFITGYEQGMRDAIRKIESEAGLSAGDFGRATVEDLLQGYESFLQQASVFAYLYGDEALATECFLKLRQIARASGRVADPLYEGGLEQFMTLKLADVMEIDISNLRQFLDAMIQRALLDGLAKGRVDTFDRFVRIAHATYDRRYAASSPAAVHVNPEARLPPFPKLVEASYESMMRRDSVPILVRARIWASTPDALRERSWPRLRESLTAQASAAALDPVRVFPPPVAAESGRETEGDAPATNAEGP
jgi:hypothetical protein